MTPKLPGQWTEDDLMALQRQQITERLDLEYKRADALENTDGKKNEVSKDVSAMANSAGGTIIYGIAEDKQTRTIRVSGGIDPSVLSVEWLEQVISSRIQRKIDGVGISQVQLVTVDPGKVAYVVSVPQSTRHLTWLPIIASTNVWVRRPRPWKSTRSATWPGAWSRRTYLST